jgi:transcriptional regulator with XRE-family HTH domain
MSNLSFAMTLRRERVAAVKTQREFAELIGVSYYTYKGWESSRSLPTADHYFKLSMAARNYCTKGAEKRLQEVYQREKMTKWVTRDE